MKWVYRSLSLAGLLLGLLVGCSWAQIAAFRAQMRAIDEYTSWEKGSLGPVFVFKAPLLSLDDLNGFEVFPEMLDERSAVLRYQRLDETPGEPGEYDIRLRFTDGRLAGLIFPAKLREGLGQENITRLFALIGGSNGPGSGLLPVPKTQLVSAGLFGGEAGRLGSEVVVDLEPLDPRNRPITLKMSNPGYADAYSSFHLNLKRRARR